MFTRGELTPEAMRMLHDQSGVVSVAQLRAAGLSPKTIRRVTASWHRVARGVFLATTPTWQSAVWAGILVAGPTGIVGGVAACHLHGIVRDPPRRIVIWTRDAKPPFSLAGADVVFRRGSRERFRTPPRSKVETSIVDATTHVDQLELIDITVRALARRHTTAARLERELATRQRVRHGATIRTLCEKANDGLESVLEWLFLRDVIRAHGLPEPERQVRSTVGRIDMIYERHGLIVELDGERDHGDWSRDMIRDNQHLLDAELDTCRYGMNAATHLRCEAARQLGALLQRGGWLGDPIPCSACK